MSATQRHFDALFADSDDPWRFRDSWYETRKRALLLAALPQPRFVRAFEPGCANGELTAALAERCEALIAADFSPRAAALARARTAQHAHVDVRTLRLPEQWPDGRFDLIVISELAYYLPPASLATLVRRARDSLADHGTLVACHWRPRLADGTMSGDDAHALIAEHSGLAPLSTIGEADFRIDVLAADARSVHAREVAA